MGECGLFMINADSDRPIGYWLKKLDLLIDAQFERQLREAGCLDGNGSCLTCSKMVRGRFPICKPSSNPFCRTHPMN